MGGAKVTCVSPHGTVVNVLRLQSARTQHHTACGFMVMGCALFSHMVGLMLSPALSIFRYSTIQCFGGHFRHFRGEKLKNEIYPPLRI